MRLLTLLPLALLVGALAPAATAQLTWQESPSRPGLWYARFDPPVGGWHAVRARLEADFDGLPVDFASIATQAEHDLLVTLAGGPSSAAFIGLTDFLEEGTWRWLDGTPLVFERWGSDPALQNARTELDFGIIQAGAWDSTSACFGPSRALIGLRSDDCDLNGVPDLYEIWTGAANDLNGNGVIDECDNIGVSFCTATPHSGGLAATITANGSAVVADNAFYLAVLDAPPFNPGLFIASETQDFVPLFAGTPGNLCLGQPLVRLDAGTGGALLFIGQTGYGSLRIDLGLVDFGTSVVAGEVWHFQFWTRDVFSSNTSNAVTVVFQ